MLCNDGEIFRKAPFRQDKGHVKPNDSCSENVVC